MEKLGLKDATKVRDIDSSVKNKFSFAWLQREIDLEIDGKTYKCPVGKDFVKVNTSGTAYCELCQKSVNYGSRGFVAISDHIKSGKHHALVKERLQTSSIKGFFSQKSNEAFVVDKGGNSDGSGSKEPENPFMVVPMCDRVSNSEAMLLGFIAENSLPFTMAPKLVDLAKSLSKDQKALNHMSMDRTSASYKMKYGMSETMKDRTVENLKVKKFSLNIDESTSSNLHKVLTILVSYYDDHKSTVVVEHLRSIDVIKVDAQTLTDHIVKIFEEYGLPWTNLVSVLMDSCNIMRGSKSGVEVRLRKYAPHLLDIDGDTCHHIHNAAKKFCAPFDWWVERLFTDLANDVKWSTDIRDAMREVAVLMDIKFTMPEQYVPHRWLSCYDVGVNTKRLYDVYKTLYYSFLSKGDKEIYKEIIGEIFQRRSVVAENIAEINDVQKMLEKKKMTSDGQKRKDRIMERLFKKCEKTELILNLYIAVLPMLKKYVTLFETKEPLIHKLVEQQEDLMAKFLACIVKPETVLMKSGRELCKIDLSEESDVFLREKDMFVGAANKKIIAKLSGKDPMVKEFRMKAATGYITCARYMQQKLPLRNPVLRAASAIGPECRGDSYTAQLLNRLPELVKTVLLEEEEEKYVVEVKDYQINKNLKPYTTGRIDSWWSEVNRTGEYPTLCKMVFALLSCFHGPQVESSFNVMGDILNSRTGRMKIDTYSAIQTVKYGLAKEEAVSAKLYARSDPVRDPVNKLLCRNLRSAARKYKSDCKANLEKPLTAHKKLQTKSENKKEQAVKAEKELHEHTLKMNNKRRREALQKLANKRKCGTQS